MIKTTRPVSIQQNDIDNGVPNDPNRCTVAMAVIRAFPDAISIRIVSGMVRVKDEDGKEYIYEIPRIVACIPVMIDAGLRDDVEPMDFVLSGPKVVERRKRTTSYPKRKLGEDRPVNPGAAKSAKQRSAAARMRNALKKKLGPHSRFLGIEI